MANQGQGQVMPSYAQDRRTNMRKIANQLESHAPLIQEFIKTYKVRLFWWVFDMDLDYCLV